LVHPITEGHAVTGPADSDALHVDDRTTLVVGPTARQDASREDRVHFLVVAEGAEHGRIIELGAEPVTIGRTPPCEVVLRDVELSRNHCRVILRHDGVLVTDLGSTNGTFVDGRRVEGAAPLLDGGYLQIGRHLLKYERRGRQEIEQRQEFDRSLEGASQYIQSLLPPPITAGPIRTEWLLLPSTRLGGDAFGHQFLDDDHFALYLLDVSGHGAEAAMLAVAVMNVLRQKALHETDLAQPAAVLRKLNAMFQMETRSSMFFTFWYGVYCLSDRTLHYASAGHHPSYLLPHDKRGMTALRTRNPAVGIIADYPFTAAAVKAAPRSRLYLFSDGVFEIVTAEDRRWELDDFLPLLQEPDQAGMAEPQRLYQAVHAVARRGPLEDDYSMLVASFE
jgi:serine phosphatase RsbU (regulator of sigma subunit)